MCSIMLLINQAETWPVNASPYILSNQFEVKELCHMCEVSSIVIYLYLFPSKSCFMENGNSHGLVKLGLCCGIFWSVK